eukprot:4194740-Amphidinium_carterae.1
MIGKGVSVVSLLHTTVACAQARDHRNKFAAGFSSAGDYGNSNSNRRSLADWTILNPPVVGH